MLVDVAGRGFKIAMHSNALAAASGGRWPLAAARRLAERTSAPALPTSSADRRPLRNGSPWVSDFGLLGCLAPLPEEPT
jgi:hypothetical protein